MREFEQRRGMVGLVRRRALTLAFLVVFGLVGQGLWGVYQKKRETDVWRQEAETKMHTLEAREADVAAIVAHLETPEGVEQALREQFDVGKEGEGVIIVLNQENVDLATTTESWWKRMWR